MKQDINVKIRGLQMADGDQNTIETISPGTYYFKNGKHYILYEEIDPENGAVTKNRIQLMPGYMELYKTGQSKVHMVFEEGEKNVTYYYTPYGSLQIGIEAKSVTLQETADSLTADVKYILELNNEFGADCHIHIEASDKGKVAL